MGTRIRVPAIIGVEELLDGCRDSYEHESTSSTHSPHKVGLHPMSTTTHIPKTYLNGGNLDRLARRKRIAVMESPAISPVTPPAINPEER